MLRMHSSCHSVTFGSEGVCYCWDSSVMEDSRPKDMFTRLPVINCKAALHGPSHAGCARASDMETSPNL